MSALVFGASAIAGAEPSTTPDQGGATAPAQGASNAAATAEQSASRPHDNPRLKVSFRTFSIANLDASSLWLEGGQADVYPLSRRYVRLGLELEGGVGHGALDGHAASLSYGMLGAGLGFQYPARVTPFVEGRVAGGVLHGSLDDGTAIMPTANSTVTGGSATTYMWLGGIDAGIELYAASRFYFSAALGWAHPTWHGVDYAAMKAAPTSGVRYKDLTSDTFTVKLGIGI